ncbi:50S ribosomal protein L17 [Hydrogenophaga sp. PAMC20947]|uniref:50S ribosomal protein L17 n=1 Tax=Hydrogenophaga sp. PAMC20947 TaxID=2565558 RepID=UPI00109DEE34|nr:50S ribosomal protein L17 [Hydrogenophaga sp. PAMC20947]QCB47660.1 50S ribosomal protein L17 [Hydrogenophaga sp. PAMC20947]
MRHRKRRKYPASSASHAIALLQNQAAEVLLHGQIITTTVKAKCLRPYLERLITKAIRANASESDGARIAVIRHIFRHLRNRQALEILIHVVSRVFADRPGGYTRLLKCGFRDGDGAEMSVFQLVMDQSPFDLIEKSDEWDKCLAAKERYALIKTHCLNNLIPSLSAIRLWATYRFPKFKLSVEHDTSMGVCSILEIPDASHWNIEDWPVLQGERVPLQLTLRFFGDSRYLRDDLVEMRVTCERSPFGIFSKERNGTALTFVLNSEMLGEAKIIVVKHSFMKTRPIAFVATLLSPYTTLRSARSISTVFGENSVIS